MKTDFNFWKRNTRLQPTSVIALLITGIAQVTVIHLLISHSSATTTSLIARGVILIVLPFIATFFAIRLAAFATNRIQLAMLTNLSQTKTNEVEQLHAHTFSKAATMDVDHLFQFWKDFFANLLFNLPVLLYLAALFLVRSQFLLVAAGVFVLILFVGLAYKAHSGLRTKHRDHHKTYIDLQDQIRNYVENIFQFRLYRSEKKYVEMLSVRMTHFSKLTARLSQFRQLYTTYVSSVLLLFLWGGLWLMQNDRSGSSAEIAVITLIFLEIRRVGNELFANLASYQRAKESANRLSQWLEEPATPQVEKQPQVLGTINVRNLIFRYKESRQSIKYPDIEIKAGEKIWLKGRNGRGKSTLWKILTGLYTTDAAKTIWLDESPAEGDGLVPFWQRIAAVTEPAKCYSGALWDVIGNFSASKAEVVSWLESHDLRQTFDTYPDQLETGYDSAVNNLSAGQLKWLLIVQAFYMQPQILILDEPFSSLDTHRQEIALRLIGGLPDLVTLIVISHHNIPISFDKTILLQA